MDKQMISTLVDIQVQKAVSSALDCVREIFLVSINRTRHGTTRIPLRYRSSSNHRYEGKIPFHQTIPRCSLPSIKIDSIYRRPSSQIQRNGSYRKNDVRYSFSLHTSLASQFHLLAIQTFSIELTEQTIQSGLLQIHDQPTNDDESLDPIHHCIGRFIRLTIDQSIGDVFALKIRTLSEQLTEDILSDALAIIADTEIYSHSIDVNRRCPLKKVQQSHSEPIDTLVNSTTERLLTDSLNYLRQIFINDQDK